MTTWKLALMWQVNTNQCWIHGIKPGSTTNQFECAMPTRSTQIAMEATLWWETVKPNTCEVAPESLVVFFTVVSFPHCCLCQKHRRKSLQAKQAIWPKWPRNTFFPILGEPLTNNSQHLCSNNSWCQQCQAIVKVGTQEAPTWHRTQQTCSTGWAIWVLMLLIPKCQVWMCMCVRYTFYGESFAHLLAERSHGCGWQMWLRVRIPNTDCMILPIVKRRMHAWATGLPD